MTYPYPEPGRFYLHYKGGIYKVMFLSKHTETGEILVNYQSIIFGTYFSRPLDSWNEKTIDGDDRFNPLGTSTYNVG
jgi:hypothetical protein